MKTIRRTAIRQSLALAATLAMGAGTSARADLFDTNGTTAGFGLTDGSTYDWWTANIWSDGNGAANNAGTAATVTWQGTASVSEQAYFVGSGTAGQNYTVRLGGTGATDTYIQNLAINVNAAGSGAFAGAAGNVTIGNIGDTGNLIIRANNSVGAQNGGTLTINNGINLNGVTTNFRGGNVVVNGVVTGAGTLVLDNDFAAFGLTSGTLTLKGANNYTATTDVRSGTLDIGGNGTSGSISSSSPLTLARTGALSLTRTDNFTQVFASTTLNAGAPVLTAATGNTIDLATITRNAGGTIDLNTVGTIKTKNANTNGILGGWATVAGANWAVSAGDGTNSGAITALGSYTNDTWAAGSNTTVTGNSSPTSGSTTNSLRFNAAGAYTLTLAGTNTITSGGILVTSSVGNNLSTITGGTLVGSAGGDLIVHQNNTSNDLTIASIVANNTSATGFTKSGAGKVTLSGNNTYTGGTFVNGGTLVISGTSTTAGSVFVNRGAMLELTRSTTTAFSASAATTVSGGGTIKFNGPTGWGGGANPNIVTIAMYVGALIDLQSGNFNGGANSNKVYTNNFASLNVASGATFGTSNVNVRMDALTGSGTIDNSSGSTGGSFTFGVGNSSGDFSGVLAASAANKFGWNKNGTGTQTLSGTSANTSTGVMTVNAGELRLNKTGVNAIAGDLTISGGTVKLMQNNQISDSSIVLLNGGTVDFNGKSDTIKRLNVNATAQMTSGDIITGVSDRGLVIGNGATGSFTLSGGKLTSTGGASTDVITNNNTGTFTINGGEYVNTGTLATNIGTGATASPARFTLTSGTATIGTLALNTANGTSNSNAASRISTVDLDGGTLELSNLTVSNVAVGGTSTFNFNGGTLKAGASTLAMSGFTTANVRNGGAIIDTANNDITISQALVHSIIGGDNATDGGLTKSGTGKLTLSNANTYTGDTTIKAGTLALGASGTIANSPKIIVGDTGSSGAVLDVSAKTSGFSIGSGQTLSGIGTVDANDGASKYTVTVSGTHAPGNSPGLQTIDGNLTYGSGSTFEWDLASGASGTRGSQYDAVDITGNLGGTGSTFKVVLNSGAFSDAGFWDTAKTWSDIFSVSGTSAALNTIFTTVRWFEGTTDMTSSTSTQGYFTISGTSLNWTAVPELSNVLIGGLLGAGLLRRRRKA